MEWIWLFGASRKGEEAYHHLRNNYQIAGFIDNDPNKRGQSFLELPVIALDDLGKQQHSDHIVICSQYVFEIMHQLLEYGLHEFSVFEMQHGIKSKDRDNIVHCSFPDDWRTLNDESLALFVHNASGSNTHALAKLGNLENDWQFTCAYEGSGSADWYMSYMTSRNFVCTHDLVVPANRNAIQLWHGFPLKGLNYMSRYQTSKHRHQHQLYWQNNRAIASYSSTYTTLMNACFGGSVEQYHITGMPRNDFMFCANGREIFENVTGMNLGAEKLIAYMPTFRTTAFGQVNGTENSALFDFSDFDLNELIRFLETNHLKMLIKMHPYEVRDASAIEQMKGSDVFCVITDDMLAAAGVDFYELMNAIDLLITDYSSIYFDYLLLDRPIIFTPTDVAEYEETRGFLLEPYDFWAPGPKCLTQHNMLAAIETNLAHTDTHRRQRNQVTSIVHHFRDGNSSIRVAEMAKSILKR